MKIIGQAGMKMIGGLEMVRHNNNWGSGQSGEGVFGEI